MISQLLFFSTYVFRFISCKSFQFGIVFSFVFIISSHIQAQEKQIVQVKTFDSKLQVLRNVVLAINDNEFITIGEKGVAIIELGTSDIPVRSITIKDEKLEAASWNFSKGILEIIVRTKSYTLVPFLLVLTDGRAAPPSEITFYGVKNLMVKSNEKGEFSLPISLQDKITAASQFQVTGYHVTKVDQTGRVNRLTVEAPKILSDTKKLPEPIVVNDGTFDVGVLDSIKSLTMFYSVFKNVFISDLNSDVRKLVDAKFNLLMAQLQDSLSTGGPSFMGSISDSSFVNEDIRSLVNYATLENEKLQANREDFQNKIDVITAKLGKGVSNLNETERQNLLANLDVLEKLLIENEGKFYQNQNDYKEIISQLKQKYFDVEVLESRLSETERQREEEQRVFRIRLIIIGGVVFLFAVLILILLTFSSRLRKQSNDLKAANEEINTINENLEKIVIKRTELLENSNKELDTFLYRASHDLRSPIRSILGLCNIQEHIPHDAYVKLISDTTHSMDSMLKKLTSISEISQEQLNLTPINLPQTIQAIVTAFSPTIDKADIQYHCDCSEDMMITSNKALLENIVLSLLENAVFFCGLKNSNQKRIQLTVQRYENDILLEVYDNGIGIEKEIQPKIFTMFYKGNEASKGNGLGLYMVSKSVQALFGNVKVESEAGRYSKFTILLPAQ